METTMRTSDFKGKGILKAAVLAALILLFGAGASFAQQTINLTAAPTTTVLPDGSTVPMWGYFCGAPVIGTTATCAALNPASVAPPATWSPVVITVPTGQALTINLTNMLTFTPTGNPTAATTANNIPTSITIVGQVGGGLGNGANYVVSPDHSQAQGCVTWFIADPNTPPGVPCTTNSGAMPPQQGNRVQSFSTEVAAGATTSLSWPFLRPGTYLLESGTHPSIQVPMGLVGMLVVTSAPSGTGTTTAATGIAYPANGTVPAVPYNAELPLLFSEIDPVQNKAVNSAVNTPGFNELNTKTFGDAVGSITVTGGGSGYTSNPAVTLTGGGGSGATASALVGAVIAGVTLSNGGSGYAAGTTVTLPAPGTGGTQATAVPNLRFGVATVTAPTTGTGAGYNLGDVLTLNSGGGTGATATVSAVTASGAITAVTFTAATNAGAGYTTAPTVSSVSGPQSVTSVALISAGTGYAVGNTISLTGGAGTGAVVTVTGISGTGTTGPIATASVTSGGSGYTSAPTVATTSTGTGTGASFVATLATGAVLSTSLSTTGTISSITITNSGSLYTTPIAASSVTISAPTGTGAAAAVVSVVTTAGTTGSIYAVEITNGGSRYSSPPSISFASGTATALASLSQSCTAGAVSTSGLANGLAAGCYPSAVNYTPFYYLINGLAFNKTNASTSLFAATAGTQTTGCSAGITTCTVTTGITGTVLVRLVNAGLRMHVPSIVGSQTMGFTGAGVLTTATNPVNGFTLIAEDGNVVPGVAVAGNATVPAAPRVQTHVFMASGKTEDVMINVPTPAGTATTPAPLPIYDRELSLSGNSSTRDAGMLAYIGVNGATIPGAGTGTGTGTGVFAPAVARADTYNSLVAGQVFSVTDPSVGVIANDTNVYGAQLLVLTGDLANGTLSCDAQPQNSVAGMCANGTFTYHPKAGSTATSDTFHYCANGAVTGTTCSSNLTAAVTLGPATVEAATGITCSIPPYTSNGSTYLKVASPGVLAFCRDAAGYPLNVAATPAPALSGTGSAVVMDPNGGFVATIATHAGAAIVTLSFSPQNSQGTVGGSQTVTLTFPAPSNLQVAVVDAAAYQAAGCTPGAAVITATGVTCGSTTLALITDYRWIIEEDRTFWVDPNCTANSAINTPGCPTLVSTSGQATLPTFGVNFHASTMPYVAQGCTGPLSCEAGQTVYDNRPTIGTAANPTYGQHIPAVCDVGNGACRPDPNCTALPCLTAGGTTQSLPSSVVLDPAKRYYISVLPGDAANPFPSPGFGGNFGAPSGCANGGVVNGALNTGCGHTMSGAPIPPACNILSTTTNAGPNPCPAAGTPVSFAPVAVLVAPTPLPTGRLSGIVFEDDFPLNGEQDPSGSATIPAVEPGLGGFNIVLWDTYGGLGDVTGQNTYDDFNMPLSNSLAGTIDPATGLDACPISPEVTANVTTGDQTQKGITSMIVTCPKFESDGATLSPLVGQFVIANLMPEKFSVQAYPGAERIARGEEWLQTNTLDGQHPHDSFIRIGEPSYFQEYGPAGYHVSIGFANPAIINARYAAVCNGSFGAVGSCSNTIQGQVDVQRQSRTPDQRLYPSGSRDALTWTQCWVSLGDPDGEDFMFTKCDANGNFKFTGVPGGEWRVTLGDQWNDQIIDGLSTPANVGTSGSGTVEPVCPGPLSKAGSICDLGNIGVQQWQANLYTRTFIDDNKNGIFDSGEIGIPFVYTMIHYRDGHTANNLVTDFNGIANFNETFPLFNWYVVEADSGRYKTTGIHTVYDAGGPADGTPLCGTGTATSARQCGTNSPTNWPYAFLANTFEGVPLPGDLSVPGAVYCGKADCTSEGGSNIDGALFGSTGSTSLQANSTGRIDPPWVWSEGWSGETSQGNWIEFGKAPYAACNPAVTPNFCVTVANPLFNANSPTTASTIQVGENGGIHGLVVYSSTRPFDTAQQMIQQPWEPNVPNVTVNLYQEGFAADGVTPTLKLVDTTQSSSWDDWAQGFYPNSTATPGTGQTAAQKPYMSCPGQGQSTGTNADLFYYTLFDQPNFLDVYNFQHNGGTLHTLPHNSQYKCYDAMHIWNQIQPAPYDGRYFFPSSLGVNPTTGKQLTSTTAVPGYHQLINSAGTASGNYVATSCTICVANPDTTDAYRVGTPMLPPGKYVVEVVMPAGYEVYKEEDKNLLIGDNFIAPVTQQFAGLGGFVFIIPDQASVASLYDPNANGYNPNNFQDPTTALALQDGLSGVPGFPGFQDPNWPCVGEMRVVPDYLSLFPQNKEVAPFAGATRPLCDRKEVTLPSQMSVSAKFFIYTSTHIASKFTGVITDDFTSEFDPFAPQFGEKFAPPNLPVSTRDYLGNEISRVYTDQWGLYDGLTFSTWEVNPPNITGYSPTMMVQCMNDPGPVLDTRSQIPVPGSSPVTFMANPTFGQLINDPLYNPAYSDFCYENAYMPGLTTYLDTPVVPTQAFVGAGYNNADCAYPDATPAIKEVDGDGIGPWVSAAGHTLKIDALGNQLVNNFGYSGPSASVAPFNATTVNRHYGFGTRCTAVGTTCTAVSSVTIGAVTAAISSWSDTQITVTVPAVQSATNPNGVPLCTIQQQALYSGKTAWCGELLITAGNGKQSVDTVTVTIGGKTPVHVVAAAQLANGTSTFSTIQGAIDAATPGDMIIVDPTCTSTTVTAGAPVASQVACTTAITSPLPTATACVPSATNHCTAANPGSHTEMVIMWKPVRLQGVGAASSVINANTQPAGKVLDPWRRHINCLFGLTLQGVPYTLASGAHPYDNPNDTANNGGPYVCPDTGWVYFTAQPDSPQIDRLPLEATVGWDAQLNGNLAELLQEPTLMGAYEGAGITVLGKGVEFHGQNPWSDSSEPGGFPAGSTPLSGVAKNTSLASATFSPAPSGSTYAGVSSTLVVGDANPLCHTVTYNTTGTVTVANQANPYPSNFICNPSSIDGLTVTNSSQGGGGIFVHGWAHFLQIANNRVYNNAGTLSGGISVGQGEFAPPYIQGSATNAPPGSCSDGTLDPNTGVAYATNEHLPLCLQLHPNVHNNMITQNSAIGDELFSGTQSGGGGATFCTGNEYYKFNFNWVCGNLSAGEGGGMVHLGEIFNGDIERNSFVFNQSTNPTIPTNGGGIMVMGTPDTDPVCTSIPDSDCPPGLSDGTGPGLVINANLIQGNIAESGSGGGIRLQQVNGTEVSTFPTQPSLWHNVTITSNIIVDNEAGWDGAGISLQDALNVNIINNTIMNNDTLASSGVLTNSIGAPLASAPAGNCVQAGTTTSCPQSAGVTSTPNSALLSTTFAGVTGGAAAIVCPSGHSQCATGGPRNTGFSNPILYNDIISQNRSFYIGVGAFGSGNQNQQKLVSLFPALIQASTGQCATGASYWDVGVRGDLSATGHQSGFTMSAVFSLVGNASGPGSATGTPVVASQYCNGSRVPPECTVPDGCGGPNGFGVPPGINDAVTPNPVFSLLPSATVDEGNNWINVSYGPLSLTNPAVRGTGTGTALGNWGGGPLLGYYLLQSGPGFRAVPCPGNRTPCLPPNEVVRSPLTDFFGNPVGGNGAFNMGATQQ
jgi:hypothetical protein